MPNWVTQNVTVKGDKQKLEKFKKDHFNNEGQFDFETIIPMPNTVFRGPVGQKEREEHGTNNWYDWSIENWGTKWNAFRTDMCMSREDLILNFDTAWSVPIPIYDKLAEMYPDLEFHVFFDEESGAFNGKIEIINGKVEEVFYEN